MDFILQCQSTVCVGSKDIGQHEDSILCAGLCVIFKSLCLRLFRKNKKVLSDLWRITDRASLVEWLESNS